MATNVEADAQLARQIALLTDALKAIRTGSWEEVDTIYCALKGGLAAPDYMIPNGQYYIDPNYEVDLARYGARIGQLLGPAIASFATAQSRLETGNGRQFSTPYNFGNIGNTDDRPKGGGAFASPEAAAEAWVRFITNDGGPTRYQAFLDAGRAGADVAGLARLIAQAGYATDPEYAEKVAQRAI